MNKDQTNINCSIQSPFHKRVYVRAVSSSGVGKLSAKGWILNTLDLQAMYGLCHIFFGVCFFCFFTIL